jgi:hypothetical protein
MEAAPVDAVPDEVAAYAAVEMARPATAATAIATTRRAVMGRSFMTIVLYARDPLIAESFYLLRLRCPVLGWGSGGAH